jgi:hypothetical protein
MVCSRCGKPLAPGATTCGACGALEEAGKVVALPPAPPCAHDPVLARSPLFELRDPVGQPVKISPDTVF